jgi:hypothetical protein
VTLKTKPPANLGRFILSNTVRTHRKLRRVGVVADLNVYEGQSHAQYGANVNAPETKEASTDIARFFDRHLGRNGQMMAAARCRRMATHLLSVEPRREEGAVVLRRDVSPVPEASFSWHAPDHALLPLARRGSAL